MAGCEGLIPYAMARLFKTDDNNFYRFFLVFWIILVLLLLFGSCRAHKTTASSFSEETTSTCGTVWTQQLLDSLVRNMQISFSGLDIWFEPSDFPIPDTETPTTDGDSCTHQGAPMKVHLRADSAAVSLQEVAVSGSQSLLVSADSTHYAADGSSETESRPQGQTGHMIVIFLLIGIMALLISKL